ncbi:MAG TPA: NAD(P)-dependent oxidoreductase [Caulobacteraceae bacterium]|jgi:citronellol/citronellal dehydrogenase|nr:NAD(P)-dependent oxidoreductase [Caulobacteraceae bacterium]
MSLKGKTLFISGASRGIGLAIALRCARDGANVVIAAKTDQPHPKLPGTIHTAAAAVEQAGGRALPLVVDIRDEASVQSAVDRAVEAFGGIDICVNNASAISLTGTLATEMKRWDLMHQVNARGSFLVSKACLPHLLKAANPHVLMLSPPLDMAERWFAPHVAYTMAKFGMSMCVLGMAGEFRGRVAFNALWPRTAIATSAVEFALGGHEALALCRTPEILADAAHLVFQQPAASFTGRFLIDDSFLFEHGVTDFDRYRVDPTKPLARDFFVPDMPPPPPGVTVG